MTKRCVLDVGNCSYDHSSIKQMIEANFDAEVDQAHGPTDTLTSLHAKRFDLVLVNRKLDNDYSDGIEIIKLLKAEEKLKDTPVMLVTNYTEQQDAAVQLGALRGFGKLELKNPATKEKLKAVLE